MKKIILPLLVFSNSLLYAQYSAYYNVNTNSNVSVNGNVNHNVSGSVFEYKTISTIDYGALQLANAQREKNRLEQQRYQSEQQKEIALQIATDPLKSYDYGSWNNFDTANRKQVDRETAKKISEATGFKSFKMSYVIPSSLLFSNSGQGKILNVSNEGIKTEITFITPFYNKANTPIDLEKQWDNSNLIVGQEINGQDESGKPTKFYLHKKDFKKADVFGSKGYRSTIIWEDKYEKGITEYYISYNSNSGNGFMNQVKVRFFGDKDEVDFEQLEGRRYYLRQLIEKIIATGKVYDEKF